MKMTTIRVDEEVASILKSRAYESGDIHTKLTINQYLRHILGIPEVSSWHVAENILSLSNVKLSKQEKENLKEAFANPELAKPRTKRSRRVQCDMKINPWNVKNLQCQKELNHEEEHFAFTPPCCIGPFGYTWYTNAEPEIISKDFELPKVYFPHPDPCTQCNNASYHSTEPMEIRLQNYKKMFDTKVYDLPKGHPLEAIIEDAVNHPEKLVRRPRPQRKEPLMPAIKPRPKKK